MLAYVLAWVIGLGSLGLYLAAFFLPEIHRKNDFIWSGLGFFYALVLWVYAQRITGGILLGQTASVTLLSWLGWETLKLRRQVTPLEQQTALPDTTSLRAQASSLQQKLTRQSERIAGLFTKARNQTQATLSATSKKDKSTQAAQPSQIAQPVAVPDAETLEKDKLESPQAVNEVVVPDQLPVEVTPITEKVKPEIEVSPQSSADAAVVKQDQESSVEVTPMAEGVESKTEPTKVSKGIKAASIKDNVQAKLTELQTKLADVPVRDRWNQLSKQAASWFTIVKDRVQGIISTATRKKGKPEVETTQPPVTPATPIDSTTTQAVDFDEKAEGTAAAIAMDEAVTGSTSVEDVELRVTDEETASLMSEATIDEEIVTEADVPETNSVDTATPINEELTSSAEEITISDLGAPNAEVKELASEVEVASETETDWPPEPEPDWSSESEPPVMEAVPPEAIAGPEASPSPDSDASSEDKAQKQNPSNSP